MNKKYGYYVGGVVNGFIAPVDIRFDFRVKLFLYLVKFAKRIYFSSKIL